MLDKPNGKKSGKGLALLIGLGRKKPDSDKGSEVPDSEDSLGSEASDSGGDDKVSMALGDLADSMGVPEENRDKFMSDFKTAVKACMEGDEPDESDSSDSGMSFGS